MFFNRNEIFLPFRFFVDADNVPEFCMKVIDFSLRARGNTMIFFDVRIFLSKCQLPPGGYRKSSRLSSGWVLTGKLAGNFPGLVVSCRFLRVPYRRKLHRLKYSQSFMIGLVHWDAQAMKKDRVIERETGRRTWSRTNYLRYTVDFYVVLSGEKKHNIQLLYK